MERIYIYAENTTRKGTIANVEPDDDGNITDDVFLWGEGDRDALISQALESLRVRRDHRAGGAADAFRWQCDRAALAYLDGPEVEYNAERRGWFTSVEVDSW